MLLVQKILQEPFLSIFKNRHYLRLCNADCTNADLQSKLAASYVQNTDLVMVLGILFYLKAQPFELSGQRNG